MGFLRLIEAESARFYKEMGNSTHLLPPSIEISVDPLCTSGLDTHTIRLNPLFLIEKADLPPHLHINDLKEIQGKEATYFSELCDWLVQFISISPLSSSDRLVFIKTLQTSFPFYFKEVWKDPLLAERWKKFALAHEVAHHTLGYPYFMRSHFFVVLSLFFFILSLPFALSFEVSAILFALSLFITSLIGLKLFSAYFYRKLEKEVDVLAFRITRDLPGAIRCLELCKKMHTSSFISSFFGSHPAPEERIRYISQIKV